MSSDPMALPSDEELMGAYGSKSDEGAFRTLYGRFQSRLFSFFQKRLPSSKPETVSDLFQKTWLKVHSSRQDFDPAQKFSTWFFTIALNTLRDHVGSAAEKTPFEELDEGTTPPDSPDDRDSQERRVLLKEDWERADAALSRLPGNQKEAFLLAEWDGLSSREIGDVLGISEAAARQLLARARQKLRTTLKEVNHA